MLFLPREPGLASFCLAWSECYLDKICADYGVDFVPLITVECFHLLIRVELLHRTL